MIVLFVKPCKTHMLLDEIYIYDIWFNGRTQVPIVVGIFFEDPKYNCGWGLLLGQCIKI